MITVDRPALSAALTWIARILPSRPSLPVLAGIHLTMADGVLQVAGTDLDQSAAVRLDAEGDDVDVVVSGRLLADLVKAISAETVTFDLADGRLVIEGGRSRFALPVLPLAQYPDLPAIPPQIGSVTGHVFADAARQVAVAAAEDTTLANLSGVHLATDPQARTLTFAATNRYRLATTTIPYLPEDGAEPEVFLIPAKTLDGYAKTYGDTEIIALHHGGDDAVLFGVTGDEQTSTTRLIDGEFPKYQHLFPTEFVASVTVEVAELVGAVKRVSLMADREQPVVLTLTEAALEVSVGAGEQSASEVLDSDYAGEEFKIQFNYANLLTGLTNLDSDKALLSLTGPSTPALIRSDDAADPYRYLLIPVRAQS